MPDEILSRPAAFLDRDGTLIVEHGFLSDPERVEILPGADQAVRLLNAWGYWVIGVSNQSGVARGLYGVDAVEAVNDRVLEEFARQGAFINRVYFCPHYDSDDETAGSKSPCDCRKPAPGMIARAAREYPIDLPHSFVAGDRACDIGLAHQAGIPGLLVLTGYGQSEYAGLDPSLHPGAVTTNLLEAVEWWGHQLGLL